MAQAHEAIKKLEIDQLKAEMLQKIAQVEQVQSCVLPLPMESITTTEVALGPSRVVFDEHKEKLLV